MAPHGFSQKMCRTTIERIRLGVLPLKFYLGQFRRTGDDGIGQAGATARPKDVAQIGLHWGGIVWSLRWMEDVEDPTVDAKQEGIDRGHTHHRSGHALEQSQGALMLHYPPQRPQNSLVFALLYRRLQSNLQTKNSLVTLMVSKGCPAMTPAMPTHDS